MTDVKPWWDAHKYYPERGWYWKWVFAATIFGSAIGIIIAHISCCA